MGRGLKSSFSSVVKVNIAPVQDAKLIIADTADRIAFYSKVTCSTPTCTSFSSILSSSLLFVDICFVFVGQPEAFKSNQSHGSEPEQNNNDLTREQYL